jgi:hypothetical protein
MVTVGATGFDERLRTSLTLEFGMSEAVIQRRREIGILAQRVVKSCQSQAAGLRSKAAEGGKK